MDDRYKILATSLGDTRVRLDWDASEYFRSGQKCQAKAFYLATNLRELSKSTAICRELGISYLVIGTGSKTIIDGGIFEGMVIKNRSDSVKIFGIKGKVSTQGLGIEEAMIEAESGTTLLRLSEYADKQGLAGLEQLADQIGTIGGAIRFNSLLRQEVYQLKVCSMGDDIKRWSSTDLSGIPEETETKTILELSKDDIILSAIFKLKSKKWPIQ